MNLISFLNQNAPAVTLLGGLVLAVSYIVTKVLSGKGEATDADLTAANERLKIMRTEREEDRAELAKERVRCDASIAAMKVDYEHQINLVKNDIAVNQRDITQLQAENKTLKDLLQNKDPVSEERARVFMQTISDIKDWMVKTSERVEKLDSHFPLELKQK